MSDNVSFVNSRNFGIVIGLLAVAIFILYNSAFVVDEAVQVVVTQFGRPVGIKQEAGLHWKIPIIQDVRPMDRRVLRWKGEPQVVPTKDRKYLELDVAARYKITDPLKFLQTVQNEFGSQSRLTAIINASTRNLISSYDLVEAVRSSNRILEEINSSINEDDALNAYNIEEDKSGISLEKINIGKEAISKLIAKNAAKELESYGIVLLDIEITRTMYADSVKKKVYDRMISERQKVAATIRSIGKSEQARITGEKVKKVNVVKASSYRQAKIIIGTAQASATKIYNNILRKDPEFYDFYRKLEAYENSFVDRKNSTLILSSDGNFFDLFDKK